MSDDALKAAIEQAAGLEPLSACARSGATFSADPDDTDSGMFSLRFLGEAVAISFPEFGFATDSRLPAHVRALLVYYLARSDSSHPTGEWTSFADLPDGRFYAAAFQGYTGDALVRRLADKAEAIPAAIASLGGRPLAASELATNADSAWLVPALPRVPVALVWWDADDEFPARAELLFDSSARNHLPIDGCAVIGSWLTAMLAAEIEQPRL
jgi:hypothetical protein